MWTLNCGCNDPTHHYIEFHIRGSVENLFSPSIQLPEKDSRIDELKDKIICEYINIIDKLECGIQEDLRNLMEEISLLEINEESFGITYSNTAILQTLNEEDEMIYTTFYGNSNSPEVPELNQLSQTSTLEFEDDIKDIYYFILTPYKLIEANTPFESLLDEDNPNRFIQLEDLNINNKLYHVWRFSLNSGLAFNQYVKVELEK